MITEECLLRLRRSGWSVGERAVAVSGGVLYVVDGMNGENRLLAQGRTSAEAWQRACQYAEAVGMLRPDQPMLRQ